MSRPRLLLAALFVALSSTACCPQLARLVPPDPEPAPTCPEDSTYKDPETGEWVVTCDEFDLAPGSGGEGP